MTTSASAHFFPRQPNKDGHALVWKTYSPCKKEIATAIPVFCIGGITFETLPTVIVAGAHRVAIVSTILRQKDSAAAVCRTKEMLADL